MSSFYAELVVAGNTYPVRRCQFDFAQATDGRGRVQAKVRHGLVQLLLDVPDNDQLLAWANTPHKALAGHVTFFETNRRTARETVSFGAGQCVGYQETFVAGDGNAGAYVCQLIITTDGLVLAPGGPAGAFSAPAAREYATPPATLATSAVTNGVRQLTGGRGPSGFGDTKGEYSGRLYDAENCGGPIEKLDWRTAQPTLEGVALVRKHVARFAAVQANQKMVARLEQVVEGKLTATDYDKRYYTHELREYERYKALNISDGVDPGYEVWNDAHSATLEDYQVNERRQPLYHPDITEIDFES